MGKSRRTVSVSHSITALEEPRFLLEVEGKLYLTLAVLEYDPKHPKITEQQRATIKQLEQHVGKGPGARAVHYPGGRLSDEVIAANMVDPPPQFKKPR